MHGTKKTADAKRIAFSKKNRSLENFTAKDRVAKGLPARRASYAPSYSGRKRWMPY